MQEAKRRAGEWHGSTSQKQASLSCTSTTVRARRASIPRRRIVVILHFNGKPRSSISSSSLGDSASAESIRPCQMILASFNSLQSDASMIVKEKRKELLPAILDRWREYPAICCSPGTCGGFAQVLTRQPG